MGVVIRELEFRNRKDLDYYLKLEYNIEIPKSERFTKELELNTVLVKAEIDEMKNEIVLRLKKLVSLKAFLLSAEAGMDINKLLFDIDSLMQMSEDGLNWSGSLISDDGSLSEFFRASGIKKSELSEDVLVDAKRSVKVKKIRGHYDFNTIVEI